MSALITVDNIVKKYKNFTLDKVSFELESGHIYGFVGENGSGKSTTMKAISSLINLDEGHVLINGKESKDLEPEEREKLGFTLDEICLPDNLKIRLINNILVHLKIGMRLYFSNIWLHLILTSIKRLKNYPKAWRQSLILLFLCVMALASWYWMNQWTDLIQLQGMNSALY